MKQRKLKYIFLFLMVLFSKIGFSQIENLIIMKQIIISK